MVVVDTIRGLIFCFVQAMWLHSENLMVVHQSSVIQKQYLFLWICKYYSGKNIRCAHIPNFQQPHSPVEKGCIYFARHFDLHASFNLTAIDSVKSRLQNWSFVCLGFNITIDLLKLKNQVILLYRTNRYLIKLMYISCLILKCLIIKN